MEYEIAVVPPGGGEADYTTVVKNATFIPRVGEYIMLREGNGEGLQVFRVLYVTYSAVSTGKEGEYQEEPPSVQAEFVWHPYQSKAHAATVERYEAAGVPVHKYPASGY